MQPRSTCHSVRVYAVALLVLLVSVFAAGVPQTLATTVSEPVLVKDIFTDIGNANPRELVNVDGTLLPSSIWPTSMAHSSFRQVIY